MARLKLEKVKEEISTAGFTLVSEDYKNLETPLKIKCKEGHIFFNSLKEIRSGVTCSDCEKIENKEITNKLNKKDKGVIRTLAIDQSTHKNGFAIFDNKKLIYSSFFSTNGDEAIERISHVKKWLIESIEKWNLDIVAIEDIQLQVYGNRSQVSTYKVLAHLQGVLLETAFIQKTPMHVIHVKTWRSYIGITSKKREDAKREARIKVKNRYGLNVTDDEAEAVCIGRYVVEKYLQNNQMFNF